MKHFQSITNSWHANHALMRNRLVESLHNSTTSATHSTTIFQYWIFIRSTKESNTKNNLFSQVGKLRWLFGHSWIRNSKQVSEILNFCNFAIWQFFRIFWYGSFFRILRFDDFFVFCDFIHFFVYCKLTIFFRILWFDGFHEFFCILWFDSFFRILWFDEFWFWI